MPERRQENGLAVISNRPGVIKARCDAAGIACRAFPRQEGESLLLDDLRPPLLLDTASFLAWELIELLVAIQQRDGELALAAKHSGTVLTTVALVDPADMRLLRLLPMCGAIQIIVAQTLDFRHLVPYLRLLPRLVSRPATRLPAYIGVVPPADSSHALSPLLLPALAALRYAPDNAAAAEQCQFSRATLMRVLSEARTALAMPTGMAARYRPPVLAELLFQALAQVEACAS